MRLVHHGSMTWHGDTSLGIRARSRRSRDEQGIASLAVLWKLGAILPISVLGAAMLVNANGDSPAPATPGPQVSEQAVEPLPDGAVPSPTPLRRAVQAVTPSPVPVTQAEEPGGTIDSAGDSTTDSAEGGDVELAAPAPSQPRAPKPSPTKQSSPPSPSPSPTPEEARQQCIEQGALDLPACVEDLLAG